MNKKVLIIDDDMDLCLLLGKLLSKNGYETEAAYTGAKGIARFAEKKFDAVICDYRLGDMEGIGLVRYQPVARGGKERCDSED